MRKVRRGCSSRVTQVRFIAGEVISTGVDFWNRRRSTRMHGSPIFCQSLGRTAEGRDIPMHANFDFATQPPPYGGTLLIGGTHGDEPATVRLLEDFLQSAAWTEWREFPVMVLPR